MSSERRKPREAYTRSLVRLCEKLDLQDTHEIDWKDRFLNRRWRSVMRAESLWAVGSYARGATSCGDLDLVLKLIRIDGAHAGIARFVSKAFPRSPGVRCYEGDPQENTSGVSFPEAVHIWSRGLDWRSAIESIRVDPNAGRFSRETDEFPLRVEQLYDDVDHIEALLKRRDAQEIAWRFLPVHPDTAIQVLQLEEWEHSVRRRMHRAGKQTQRLIPHVLEYLRREGGPFYSRLTHTPNSTALQVEGTFISMGRPTVADHLLDTLEVSRVLSFPHFSQRGPNGILEVRRDANHSLTIRFHELSAYVLPTEDDTVYREYYATRFGIGCALISLFATTGQASHHAKEETKLDLELKPVRLKGTALLDTLSLADAVDVQMPDGDIHALCLTHMGRVVFGEHDQTVRVTPVGELLALLAELS